MGTLVGALPPFSPFFSNKVPGLPSSTTNRSENELRRRGRDQGTRGRLADGTQATEDCFWRSIGKTPFRGYHKPSVHSIDSQTSAIFY